MPQNKMLQWIESRQDISREKKFLKLNRTRKEKFRDFVRDTVFWTLLSGFFLWLFGGLKGVLFVAKIAFVAMHVAALMDIDLDRSDRIRAVDGMLSALDTHSGAVSSSRTKSLMKDVDEARLTAGMLLQSEGPATIKSIVEGGIADEAGLMVGDEIIWIFSKEKYGSKARADKIRLIIENLDSTGFEDHFESIKLGVVREEKTIEVNLQMKKKISLNAYDLGVTDSILHIDIPLFDRGVTQSVIEIIETRLAEEEVKGVIFDLRGNPGGLMDEYEDLSDIFVSKGSVIGKSSGRGVLDQVMKASKEKVFPQIETVGVVIDKNSASASEGFAAFVQDAGLGPIAGEVSTGKGSQQAIVPLKGVDPFRITVGRFTGPSGSRIDGVGVSPNILVEKNDDGVSDWEGLISKLRAEMLGRE
jgi:carboxyl-terminal processing protease